MQLEREVRNLLGTFARSSESLGNGGDEATATFVDTGAAFASVGVIVLRHDLHIAWSWMIMTGWVLGVAMQIVAGAIARRRR